MAKIKEKQKITLPNNFLTNVNNRLLEVQSQRILFYACWKYDPKTSTSKFTLDALEKQFKVNFQNFQSIRNSLSGLSFYKYEIVNEEKRSVKISNVFTDLDFESETFELSFNPKFKETIEETNRQFLQYGLNIVAAWKCKYTYLLYSFIKESMWDQRHGEKIFTKEEFRTLFKIEDKEYQDNNDFKRKVWQRAMIEINETTGYTISIEPLGRGKKINYLVKIIDQERIVGDQNNKKTDYNDLSYVQKVSLNYSPTPPDQETLAKALEIQRKLKGDPDDNTETNS